MRSLCHLSGERAFKGGDTKDHLLSVIWEMLCNVLNDIVVKH